MSYDIAVWVGERPGSDDEASAIFEALMDRMEAQDEADSAPEPSPAIRSYLEALLARWPDITDERGDDSPWAEGPLMLSGSGDIAYFSMVYSRADEGVEYAARIAAEHGLICYDPQLEELAS